MKNFVKYAQYYDILYMEKNYKREVDHVDRLIRYYSARRGKTLLDIGCGTGSHDIWFAKKGYRVVGIDKSDKMISIAKNKMPAGIQAEFFINDASMFSLHRKFDIAVSLFHVMSYLTTNKEFIKSLRNIYVHLKRDGLFIFDFWYGPAVLTQGPVKKTKSVSDENINIKRIAAPKINFDENTVNVNYKSTVINKNSDSIKTFDENHKMRYFFLPELSFMLGQSGFKILKSLKCLSAEDELSPRSWNGMIIARKDR